MFRLILNDKKGKDKTIYLKLCHRFFFVGFAVFVRRKEMFFYTIIWKIDVEKRYVGCLTL